MNLIKHGLIGSACIPQPQEILNLLMMMNCFCGMVDQRKAFSLISSRNHCQRSSPSRISDKPQAGFQPVQNLSSGLVECSCALALGAIFLQAEKYVIL